jgi:hypothetical protein
MNPHEKYLAEVREVLKSAENILTVAEIQEVEQLICHGEPPEALRSLAWIIVEENKMVPARTIEGIRKLTTGLLDPDHLPPNLDSHIER